jgi:hypothetical protein
MGSGSGRITVQLESGFSRMRWTTGGCVADLSRDALRRLAQLGARARLEELRREEAAIRRAFPDLFGRRRGRPKNSAPEGGAAKRGPRKRRRGRMSAAARRAVSQRMKKYWADRRKKGASK